MNLRYKLINYHSEELCYLIILHKNRMQINFNPKKSKKKT